MAMAHLCSAHLGKKPRKTKSEVGQRWEASRPSQDPTPRGDEYGFLPWYKGEGSLPRACRKHISSGQTSQNAEILPCKDRKREEERKFSVVEPTASPRVQRFPMSEIMEMLREKATRGMRTTSSTRRRILQSPQHRSASFPRDYQEFVARLESSNVRNPANIPVLVTMNYKPNDTLVRGGVIRVTKGMIVNAIYKCQDWLYVTSPENQSGYVPFECLDPIGLTRTSCDFAQQFPDNAGRLFRSGSVGLLDTTGTTGSPFPSPGGKASPTVSPSGIYGSPFPSPPDSPRSVTTYNDGSELTYECIPFNTSDQSRKYLSDDSGIHDKPEDSIGEGASTTTSVDLEKSHTKIEGSPIYENIADVLDHRLLTSSTAGSSAGCSSTGCRLTVLFDYIPIHSQDLSVRAHEVVRLISEGEGDWVWVEKQGGARGFIPRNYAINLARFNLEPDAKTTYL